ncbi:ATP-binding protein [Mixta gaviniae]|uniref:ATP-binding protein n=1 Tax=Mixta gaviniae TaxID=665914 RepID=A0A2L0IGE4_9GAMM|nr:ATP-binding protein [Mixta gaviniae]AUX93462.1 ATP-binding protein [Mixta gaviniae]
MMSAIEPRTLTLCASLNSLPVLGEQLRRFFAPLALEESWIFMLDLALCEAATNIIRHGYRQDRGKSYVVTMAIEEACALVTLRDSGEPIPAALLNTAAAPPAPAQEADDAEIALALLSESGRGLRLIHDCVDDVSYRQTQGENCLTLIKRLPASVSGTASAQT